MPSAFNASRSIGVDKREGVEGFQVSDLKSKNRFAGLGIGSWNLVFGFWFLDLGIWFLEFGLWNLKQETRNKKPETRNLKQLYPLTIPADSKSHQKPGYDFLTTSGSSMLISLRNNASDESIIITIHQIVIVYLSGFSDNLTWVVLL